MKRKLTVNTLALGNLKQRKKQYSIMVIGIILAMVFSSSILFFLFSAAETSKVNAQKQIGLQDSIIYVNSFSEKDYKNCVKEGLFSDYAFAHTIGYGYTVDDEENLGASVAWLDDKAKELSYQIFLEGSYPKNENEVAIEKNALTRLGYKDVSLGDTIKLKLKVQSDNDYLDSVDKEYTLVGIVSDKKKNIESIITGTEMLPAIFVAQNTRTELGGKEKLVAYITIDDENDYYKNALKAHRAKGEYADSSSVLYDYFTAKNLKYDICEANYSFESRGYTISGKGEYAVIIAIVLVFASCVAIINSFNTNLKERKSQIGMLRAVGATKRQIINIFGREAFIISLISSPVSILVSFFIVKILLKIFSEDAVMSKSIIVLPIAFVLNIFVVMLAALVPLVAASKITPMQAIRNITNNRKVKTKKIKSKPVFNAPSHLAKRNLAFYKGGRFAVSVMLIATILFSCLGFSFMAYSKDNFYENIHDYSLEALNISDFNEYSNNENFQGLTESERIDIESMPYVSQTYGCKKIAAVIHTDTLNDYLRTISADNFVFNRDSEINSYDDIKERINDDPNEYYYTMKDKLQITDEMFPSNMYSYDEKQLSLLEDSLVAGEIDYNKLASGEEIILVAPQKVEYRARIYNNGYGSQVVFDDDLKTADKRYTTISKAECPYKAGDTIDITIAKFSETVGRDEEGEYSESFEITEKTDKTVKIGAIVSPCQTSGRNSDFYIYDLSVITSAQGMNSICPGVKYESLEVDVDEKIDDSIDTVMMEKFNHYADKYNGYASSNYQNIRDQQKSYNSLYTAMLALIIIGFVICASIINNSISARIRENKRVIGTLRAVGAAEADLVKSYLRQMLSMFTWGIAIGYGGFVIAFYVFKAVIGYTGGTMELYFSPWATIAMTVVLFAVCAINVWSKIRKEIKNSIVENIREL
ncbi:MAG: ABC transporter permease [Eubacterium sp.]